MRGRALVLACALAAACHGGDDGVAPGDGAADVDAPAPDAPAPDAPSVDAAVDASTCQPLHLTAAEACAIALTGRISACATDPVTGQPSQRGAMAVRRPDGTTGYLCADSWSQLEGYSFLTDRVHLVDQAAACCGGPPGTTLAWPAVDAALGTAHGPTHVKPQETVPDHVGPLLQNPFALIIASPEAGAAFAATRLRWLTWAGDGQPHPAPDGTGAYYFRQGVAINYLVAPTASGAPVIVIAPEVSTDAAGIRELGHPTLGLCAGEGGTPLAYLGGDIRGSILSNRSGRFGREATITPAHLAAAAELFRCYGIAITGTNFLP